MSPYYDSPTHRNISKTHEKVKQKEEKKSSSITAEKQKSTDKYNNTIDWFHTLLLMYKRIDIVVDLH